MNTNGSVDSGAAVSQGIDCILVVYNSAEIAETIGSRLLRLTRRPIRVIIVDNSSDAESRIRLRRFAAGDPRILLIGSYTNRFCCHGTNLGLSASRAPFVFYFCSKEAFPMFEGWEEPCLAYMDAHPRVGFAGTLVEVPRYRTGADYLQRDFFAYFRNQHFAAFHPDRVFRHVQGGFFLLRRSMFEEIGYFNERLYHNYMDVEYSYYVESCGWELGDIPAVKIRHYWEFKTGEFERDVAVYHPLNLERLAEFDRLRARS